MIREEIKNLIKEALKNLGIEEIDFNLEHPADLKMGDYSTNVAMVLSKKLGRNPKELAEQLRSVLTRSPQLRSVLTRSPQLRSVLTRSPQSEMIAGIFRVEVAGPGFINFYLSKDFFADILNKILKEKENFGWKEIKNKEKTIVEYTDPNPFKEFHIGHLMSNTAGESISRIVEANGSEVKRACYQGDVGMHVAKAVWGYLKQKDWKTSYAYGAKAYDTDENSKKEIEEINKKIYLKDKEIMPLYEEGRKISLEAFEKIYKKLGTKFDFYFFESETAELGQKIVLENTDKVFEKGDNGAIVFHAEKFNKKLHTRVFINSIGLPTYEAKELGLAKIKYDKYQYDRSIVITGNEINDYFKVLLEAMKNVFPELASKTLHFSHGMLRLPSGKMSSRTGDVITAESLLSAISEKVIDKVRETNRGEMSDDFINQVSVAALKYSILKQSVGADVIYDFEKSISFEGDSGPYLQYSYARAKSILEKAKESGITENFDHTLNEIFENMEDGISEVERLIYRFPEIVEKSGNEFAPHHIANYLIELARSFNAYYGNTKIVDREDPSSSYKVALTRAFSIVMKNGLYLLGIEAPEKM